MHDDLLEFVEDLLANFNERKERLTIQDCAKLLEVAQREYKITQKHVSFPELLETVAVAHEFVAKQLMENQHDYRKAQELFLIAAQVFSSLEVVNRQNSLEKKLEALSKAQQCEAYQQITEGNGDNLCTAGRMLVGAAKILRQDSKAETCDEGRNLLGQLIAQAAFYYGIGLQKQNERAEAWGYTKRAKTLLQGLLYCNLSPKDKQKVTKLLELVKKELEELERLNIDMMWLFSQVTDPAPLITIKEPEKLFIVD